MSESTALGENFVSGLEIIRLLSPDGYFSDVFEGFHPIHKKVAVKVLKPIMGENLSQFNARQPTLYSESLKLKAAEHRNVVRVLDVLRTNHPVDPKVVMVTEFCGGGSAETLAAGAPLRLPQARKILTDTAMGLQHLHSLGMIHRDIKPGNILIDDKGVGRIADFGFVDDAMMNGIGLPNAYRTHKAPECFGANAIGTFRSDIWAFGLTVYRLLHSELDWDEIKLSVPVLVTRNQLIPHLKWLPHIPMEWRNVIKRCLSPNPAGRYETFVDVVAALERLPIEPDWVCQSSLTSVKWTRDRGTRVHEVVWDRADANLQRWSATNRPRNGVGKQLTLSTSNGLVSGEKARAGLEQFFEGART